MKFSWLFIILILLNADFGFCQNQWQPIKYAPAWFGPNANPVPDFTYAYIPKHTQLTCNQDVYFGYGDLTISEQIKLEIPLIPSQVSFKIWGTPIEYYQVTPALASDRIMKDQSGFASGDYYVQTRIKILKATEKRPGIVFNSTLKTASSSSVENKRFFNTAGYYFDLEIGKSIITENELFNVFILTANLGFMSWDVKTNLQDDAALYGTKFTVMNPNYELNLTWGGYWGWLHTHPKYGLDYGDAPMVSSVQFVKKFENISWSLQYQYGINDFPYHQMRVGLIFNFENLTPKI